MEDGDSFPGLHASATVAACGQEESLQGTEFLTACDGCMRENLVGGGTSSLGVIEKKRPHEDLHFLASSPLNLQDFQAPVRHSSLLPQYGTSLFEKACSENSNLWA